MDPDVERELRDLLIAKKRAVEDARTDPDAERTANARQPNPADPLEALVYAVLQKYAALLKKAGWRAFLDDPLSLSVSIDQNTPGKQEWYIRFSRLIEGVHVSCHTPDGPVQRPAETIAFAAFSPAIVETFADQFIKDIAR